MTKDSLADELAIDDEILARRTAELEAAQLKARPAGTCMACGEEWLDGEEDEPCSACGFLAAGGQV